MSAARRRLAGLLGVALALSLAGQTATAEAASRPKKRRQVAVQVNLATYNTSAQVRHQRAARDVRDLAAQADILALQEMSSAQRRKQVRAYLVDCDTCLFEGYMPREAVRGGTPILWRKDKFTLEGSGTMQVSEPTYVGPEGAGPDTLRAKYINWVQLREVRTERDVFVLNNHTVPSVEAKGRPNARMPERVELYRQHMVGLSELVTQFQMTGGVVFALGDFNVNFRGDKRHQHPSFPYATTRGVGMQASYDVLGQPSVGTFKSQRGRVGTRLIDYVHASTSPGVTPTRQTVLTSGYASDHRPYVATYRLVKQPRRALAH